MNKNNFGLSPFQKAVNYPGLMSAVIDNEIIMDFSPKPELSENRLKTSFCQKNCIFITHPDTPDKI
jgi:hypothetical protein